jgi:uncharacterized protein Yka (UPF0111/DUF47 family)
MLEELRTKDMELFEQLASVCHHLGRSARLLELMLAGRPEQEAGFVQAIHENDQDAHEIGRHVDARAFKAFVMRVDRMELHSLASALDAAVDAVEKAAAHGAALHASGAPAPLRALAALLTRAADALEGAVRNAWDAPAHAAESLATVARLAEEGEATVIRGIGELFADAADPVDVLRWKDIYEKISHALDRCAGAADALKEMTHSTS